MFKCEAQKVLNTRFHASRTRILLSVEADQAKLFKAIIRNGSYGAEGSTVWNVQGRTGCTGSYRLHRIEYIEGMDHLPMERPDKTDLIGIRRKPVFPNLQL
jgi:hypothetical protein